MPSKKFWTLIVSAVLLLPTYKIVQACSDGGDPYDYFPSFFEQTTAPGGPFTPFYYTSYLKYYDEWYDYQADSGSLAPDANIEEWKAFTGHTIPTADLDSFIYRFPYAALSNMYSHLEKGTPLMVSDTVRDNGFTKWFISHKDLEALGYLMYAKQCEPHAGSDGFWAPATRDTARMARLVKNGLQLHAAAKQDFFKWRYAYQTLRMSFYSGRLRQTLDLYKTLIGDKTDGGVMYGRCLGLKAGALYHSGRNAEAAYLYSRVFDFNDEGKRSAFISYDWAGGHSKPQVLALCATPHQRAVVHLMNGLHQFEQALPEMQAAFSADPNVAGLDVLMTREIQKCEERYLEPKLISQRNISAGQWYYNHYDMDAGYYDEADRKKASSTAAQYSSYLSRLASFAASAEASGAIKRKAFWQLAQGYIAFMQGDIARVQPFLDKAQQSGMTAREHDLHDIIHVLYLVQRPDRLTPAVEAELLPSLQWLDGQAGNSRYLSKAYRDLMSTVLVTAYLRDKDTVKAAFVLARAYRGSDRLPVSTDFEDMPGGLLERMSFAALARAEAFSAGGGGTAYERWLLIKTPYPADVLYELEGTRYLREHNWDKAVAALKKVSAKTLEERPLVDYTVFHISDDIDPAKEDSGVIANKLRFARRMGNVEVDIAQKEGGAERIFEYAMGLYGMTYYGKVHEAFAYYRSTVDDYGYYESPERRALPAYLQDYYGAITAETYFVKAAAATTDPVLKGKALWMAARCWQKRCPISTKRDFYDGSGTTYYNNALRNPYFPQLQASGGPVFEQARSSCGYLEDYLHRKK